MKRLLTTFLRLKAYTPAQTDHLQINPPSEVEVSVCGPIARVNFRLTPYMKSQIGSQLSEQCFACEQQGSAHTSKICALDDGRILYSFPMEVDQAMAYTARMGKLMEQLAEKKHSLLGRWF